MGFQRKMIHGTLVALIALGPKSIAEDSAHAKRHASHGPLLEIGNGSILKKLPDRTIGEFFESEPRLCPKRVFHGRIISDKDDNDMLYDDPFPYLPRLDDVCIRSRKPDRI